MQPLDGLVVLDFSTLVPGPMASLILAEAGARVIKIERPGGGDEMRSYEPKIGADSINFHLLNRGKESVVLDLKAPDALARLTPLLERADILIEQFRPGVMTRLGLGYDAVRAINPGLIYCSITGWGQSGPKSTTAAHDLNYLAETGILALAADAAGAPIVPPVLIADLAGGTYPALFNILLALRQRDAGGQGCHLDIAMGDGLFTLAYWGLGNGYAAGAWPVPGRELVTGGSPRYRVYRTADDKFVAAAPLEDKFWDAFCHILDLPHALRDPAAPPHQVIAEIAARIGVRTADEWRMAFAGKDVCCSIVADLEQAVTDAHTIARKLFDHRVQAADRTVPALPVPVVPAFRSNEKTAAAPALGAHNPLWLSATGSLDD